MDPIIEFKKTGRLPSDPSGSKYVKEREKWFEIWDETLYKKAFNRPLLKCITREDGLDIFKEFHEGACASHIGGKIIRREGIKDRVLLAHLKRRCPNLC